MPSDSLDFSQRANLTELMDEPCSRDVLRACLRDIARTNRWTFAYRPLFRWLDEVAGTFAALDVPVRITGPFGDPNIVPDLLSAAPARSGEVNLASLPVELETLAQANPCPP